MVEQTEFAALCDALGWSIKETMDHLGVQQSTVYSYRNGARPTPAHTLALMRIWVEDAENERAGRVMVSGAVLRRLLEIWRNEGFVGTNRITAEMSEALRELSKEIEG